jgi:hypothetical protein
VTLCSAVELDAGSLETVDFFRDKTVLVTYAALHNLCYTLILLQRSWRWHWTRIRYQSCFTWVRSFLPTPFPPPIQHFLQSQAGTLRSEQRRAAGNHFQGQSGRRVRRARSLKLGASSLRQARRWPASGRHGLRSTSCCV